jgi:hypothetical protein
MGIGYLVEHLDPLIELRWNFCKELQRSGLILTPVVSLSARIVAEPFVPADFPFVRGRRTMRDYSVTIFTAGQVPASLYHPKHLQVHGPE